MNIKDVKNKYHTTSAWVTNADVYGVECEINVGYVDVNPEVEWDKDNVVHFFEVSDIKTGGNIIYEEGNLVIEGNELVDYDGVCELAMPIIDILEHKGYDIAHIKETLA